MTKNPPQTDLPKGIHRIWTLPNPTLGALWDPIILPESLKTKLVSPAIVNFTVRPKVDRSVVPLHEVLLLVGLPGTGKTSLARGLAHRVAESLKGPAASWNCSIRRHRYRQFPWNHNDGAPNRAKD
jgi:hypothetical protein